ATAMNSRPKSSGRWKRWRARPVESRPHHQPPISFSSRLASLPGAGSEGRALGGVVRCGRVRGAGSGHGAEQEGGKHAARELHGGCASAGVEFENHLNKTITLKVSAPTPQKLYRAPFQPIFATFRPD